jgi:hypothetical protein
MTLKVVPETTKFGWEQLKAVTSEHRSKVPTSRVGNFAGVHLQIGWLAWHQLSSDHDFLKKGWARGTPVVFDGKPSIWIPAIKAILTIVPEVAPPEIKVEHAPL